MKLIEALNVTYWAFNTHLMQLIEFFCNEVGKELFKPYNDNVIT